MRASSSDVVVVEPERHPEAVAERRRQQTRPGRRADERERRQVERERARRRALAHDDVDAEVLERRVEHLLGGAVEAVDLVDEEHVALLERGQDRRDVLPLERRAGDGAEADAELLADDVGEARLAEPGRAGEQHVVERLAARERAASRAIESCSLIRSWPTKSSSLRGRSERSSSSSSTCERRARGTVSSRGPPQGEADALLGRKLGIDVGERALGVDERVAELDERVARDEVGRTRGGRLERGRRELLLQLEHDALRGLAADARDRLEAGRVVERDRAAELGAAATRTRSRARPSGRPRRPRAGARTARAPRRRRTRRAAVRPRGRGGRSRPSPRRRRSAARSAVGVACTR